MFDKGRGLGGRLASRRFEEWRFDHGAVVLQPKTPALTAYLHSVVGAGQAAYWPAGAGWVGVPGMNAVVKPLADGMDITLSAEVDMLVHRPEGWTIAGKGVPESDPFDQVVLAIPQPQVLRLLAQWPEMTARLAGASMRPCWAVMAAFATDLPTDTNFATFSEGPLSLVARDTAKPGRSSTGDSWVIHAGADWSRAHLELDRDSVVAPLLAAFFSALACDPVAPVVSFAHRWRFGVTDTPLGRPFVLDPSLRFGLCGDWCLGDTADAAFESGRALAAAILATGE